MSSDLLNLEIRLLIARYGYPNILGALAKLKETTIEEIENRLASLEARKKARKKRPPRTWAE